jgi:hypothetical protein
MLKNVGVQRSTLFIAKTLWLSEQSWLKMSSRSSGKKLLLPNGDFSISYLSYRMHVRGQTGHLIFRSHWCACTVHCAMCARGQSKYRLAKEWEKNTKKTRENTRRIPTVQEGFVCYMYVHCMSYIWPSFLFSVAIRVTRSVAKFLVPELGGYSRLRHRVFMSGPPMPMVSLIPVVHLDFETDLKGYSGAGGN